MAGSGRNSLRAALQERGWSYTRLAAELRRHAAGSQLPKTESLVTLISRWVNNHQQPDDFYRDLLAKALGRSRATSSATKEPTWSLGRWSDLLSCPTMWPISSGAQARSTNSVAACSAPVKGRMARSSPSMGHLVLASPRLPSISPTSYASTTPMRNCSPTCGATRARGSTRPSFYTSSCVPSALPVRIPSTMETAARAFRSRLAGRRVLVVLDNAVSERQVRPLLPGSPTCAVLITSRCPLPGLAEATALTLELFPTSGRGANA